MDSQTGGSTIRGRVVVFGEVLFDRFPDGSEVLGGAPFNVAWNLRGLGHDPLLITRVGDDELGRRIRMAMASWGMDTSQLQQDSTLPTGTVEIQTKDGGHTFDIVDNQAYDAIEVRSLPSGFECALAYHGTLALRRQASRRTWERLSEDCQAPIFLDVNLRAPWWDLDEVRKSLRTARTVKLSEDEFETLGPQGSTLSERAFSFLEETSTAELYVTRGSEGAEFFVSDGHQYQGKPVGDAEVVDTVGAGDAFAAVAILGKIKGWPREQILARAQGFASAVVGLRGATVRDDSFYRTFREAWSL